MKERNQNARGAFGRYLQRKRREAQISIAEVSHKTCIRPQTIRAIEKEEHHRLPADTYVKGLLRSFARSIGADPDQAVERYEQSRRELQSEKEAELRLKKAGRGRWWKQVVVLGLLFAVAVASVYLMRGAGTGNGPETDLSGKSEKLATNPSEPGRCPSGTEKQLAAGQTDNQGIPPVTPGKSIGRKHTRTEPGGTEANRLAAKAKTSRPSDATRYLLSIQVISDTWLKVIADDREAVKYQLKTGDRLDLTAFTRFNILIGNARGVRLSVNDKPIVVSGKKGQIVNINIP